MLDSNLGRFGHNKFLRIRLRGAEIILQKYCVYLHLQRSALSYHCESDHRNRAVQWVEPCWWQPDPR